MAATTGCRAVRGFNASVLGLSGETMARSVHFRGPANSSSGKPSVRQVLMAMTRACWWLAVLVCGLVVVVAGVTAVAEGEAAAPAEAGQVQERAAGAAAGSSAPAEAAATAEYRIRPGDTLSITVLGEPTYSGSFTVRPDGTILFSDDMVGPVPVGGMTTKEATETVASRIGEYVKDPTVVLAVSRFRIMVVGNVRRPGQYDLNEGARLMDAVNAAGGVEDEKRDLGRIYLTKASGEEHRYDLEAFKEKADATQNVLVEPGDKIAVGRAVSPSRREGEFKLTGAFAKPGTYRLDEDEDTRISDAVERGGRWTTEGNPRAAKLIRADGTQCPIDLTLLDGDPRGAENLVLRDGDELFVPRNTTEVNVLGAVAKPGEYFVAPGTTLLEAIATAGGLKETAILESCAVVRSDPPVRVPANLKRLLQQGDVTQNPVLENRDVVFVPERPPSTGTGSKTNWFQTMTDNAWRYIWLFRYF